jgi:hypothetical protein
MADRFAQIQMWHSQFGDTMSERADLERAVAENLGWEVLSSNQRTDGLTCQAPDGAMIALRFDWPSTETGNHYLEVESRENRESAWKPSGFGIAQKKAQFWAVVNDEDVFVADVNKLARLLKKQRRELEDHVSRRNVGSHDKRMYARGYLLPLEDLEGCCSVICPSPVNAPDN